LSLEVKKSSQEVGGIRFFVEDIKSRSWSGKIRN